MRAWIHLCLALSLSVTASISAARMSVPDSEMSGDHAAMSHAMTEAEMSGMDNSSSPHHHQACEKCPPVFASDPTPRPVGSSLIDLVLDPGYYFIRQDRDLILPDWLNMSPARAPPFRLISANLST